jgi:GNAT superfamily N-acetyltransferase
MPKLILLKAVLQDLEGVYNLLSQTDSQYRQAHPEIFQQAFDPGDTKDYLLSNIKSKDAVIILALVRDDIIGAILAWGRKTPEISILLPNTFVIIENLVVDEPFRRQGIGKALLEQVHLWSKSHGTEQIQFTVWDFNQAAHEFNKKMGYSTLHHLMRKDLA